MGVLSRLVVALPLLAVAAPAAADAPSQCHVVDVDFVPVDGLQIVAWIEKADGTFVDTIYLTQKVGRYGLGNRPGRFDFNSGPLVGENWPYGRRITVFPVWAHRHGKSWPEIDYQNGDDNNLSHPFSESSTENAPPYCRPMMQSEAGWDAGSCASGMVYTDKGVFSTVGATSLYPPRSDVARKMGIDSPSVDMYKQMNPFDAITQATPAGGQDATISWPIPQNLAMGNYVMFLEVSKSFDFNATYNQTSYPPPSGIPWSEYGVAYRGQPSIVYSVPFTIGAAESIASTQAYKGYGDPSGATGTLNPPDSTITTNTPGSGASRLQILPGSTGDVVRVDAKPETITNPPSAIAGTDTSMITSSSAVVQFVAPGSNGGGGGSVAGYEIRYRANDAMTPDNFASSMVTTATVVPTAPGTAQAFQLTGLLPSTDYWVGIRAYDACRNYSNLAILQLTTADRQNGSVDACFVATAAYGSLMANDVEMLRHFRDALLETTVLGELGVEAYYTFGPAVAGVVGESELLRATARAVLAPIVATVRRMSF